MLFHAVQVIIKFKFLVGNDVYDFKNREGKVCFCVSFYICHSP